MRLTTILQPRVDGTVIARINANTYIFMASDGAELACEVADEDDAAILLRTGNFLPADAGGYRIAAALNKEDVEQAVDDDDEPVSMDALPVEANTPPSRKRAKKAA